LWPWCGWLALGPSWLGWGSWERGASLPLFLMVCLASPAGWRDGGGCPKVVAAIVLEKVLLAAGTAAILFWAGAVGLQGELPSALRQGVFSLAGAAAFIAGATLVGATRRTPWASRCLTFARRFLPRWAFLERGNKALLEVQTALQKALSDHREAVAKAAGFIALMVCFNALAPLIFFALAYSRILSAEELAVFLALGNISSLLFWLTPGGIGVAEGEGPGGRPTRASSRC